VKLRIPKAQPKPGERFGGWLAGAEHGTFYEATRMNFVATVMIVHCG
jgi:hypothetical protein